MEVDSSTTTTTICSQCGLMDHKILHNVRLNGTFRRLCTTCVLRLHRTSFCPSCLVVYHPSPPENAVFCYRCHSSSHRTCISPSVTGRTPCATCLNPNRLVFNPKSPHSSCNSNWRIDVTAARLLVAAAEISLASMSKAEEDAVMEVDWRVTEAADWRKKAKEAVNRFVKLTEIVKKRRDDNSEIDIEVSEDLNAVNLDDESIFRMMEI